MIKQKINDFYSGFIMPYHVHIMPILLCSVLLGVLRAFAPLRLFFCRTWLIFSVKNIYTFHYHAQRRNNQRHDSVMNYFMRIFNDIGEYFIMVMGVLMATLRRPPHWELIRNQLYDIGVSSLPVVSITGFSTGIVLAAQSFFQLSEYGLTSATGLMVTKAMMVELGPVLTAFMITGRVGASMCAELGTMKVTEQVDALRSMAVNPLRYLIAPRFIAGLVMLPLLTVYSCFMGICGGYMISVGYYGMSHSAYMDPLPSHIDNFDFFSGIFKALFFGIVIISVCCYRGIMTRGGAQGVGRATTNSVVISYSIILISNFLLTIFLNGSYSTLQKYVPWLVM